MTPDSAKARHRVEIERCDRFGYDCVHFRARSSVDGDTRAPVRIFLGTEDSQWRAERVFLWSVTRFGDPARDYEVHRMANLDGFDPRSWTTGFTNYRFAIPTFAEETGRALYNDVDQIYLHDPGALFDLELGDHGFLARTDRETSVMLLDCGRMAAVWTLDAARARHKRSLHRRAAALAGLRGSLDPRWNARDTEHDPERPGVLHFTTLHTQPWRPFPHHFHYEPHPLGALWHALDEEAETAGFALYTRDRPSTRFAGWTPPETCADVPDEPLATLAAACGVEKTQRFDERALRGWLGRRGGAARPEALGCALDGSRVPAEDQPWILDALFSGVDRVLVLLDHNRDREGAEALAARVEQRARHAPGVTWHLRSAAPGPRRVYNGGPAARPTLGDPPRVWWLRDDRAGNTTQALGLVEALGWAADEKPLRFDRRGRVQQTSIAALAPPWPDLVIAAGGRSASVALALRERAGGLPRLVQLGRKGAAHAERFDLAVTPRAARLWPHPRRHETLLPVCRELRASGEATFGDAASPRLALLVGGGTARLRVDTGDVVALAEQVERLRELLGGSLFVTTSPRSPAGAAEAVAARLPGARVYGWRPDDPSNPLPGLLGGADVLIVTGESESMLAEAAATEAALVVAPIGRERPPTALQRIGERVVARARHRPSNDRGTPAPQRGLERWCAGLVARGRVRPLRDLEGLRRELVANGRAHRLEEVVREPAVLERPVTPLREAERAAQRVRALFESRAGPA